MRFKNIILLIFSLIFYAWGEPFYVFLLIGIGIFDYYMGLKIEKHKNKKIIFISTLILHILLFVLLKYTDFIIIQCNYMFSLKLTLPHIQLPLGISFITFQTISYLIDVYTGKIKAEKNFISFMTYVTMFPQLIAGPIVRFETIQEQLNKREITLNHVIYGWNRFVIGLSKKVILADNIGKLFATIYISSDLSLFSAWLGIIAFAFQIYFDFSGYSDMAIGLGSMLGFTYHENFNYPYISKSISEFWDRWHISLSSFFKEYVYFNLGGNRCSISRNFLNLMIVWLLTGLWHGAGINYMLWGIYFGLLLILEKTGKKVIDKLPKMFKHLSVLICLLIGWVIFVFEDFGLMSKYFKYMFVNANVLDHNFLFYLSNYKIILVICVIASTPLLKKLKDKCWNSENILCMITEYSGYLLLFVYSISCMISESYHPFLYFNF